MKREGEEEKGRGRGRRRERNDGRKKLATGRGD